MENLVLPNSINLINGIIAFLGMALFFLQRFRNRKDKKNNFLIKYWIKDNLLELIISLVTSIALFLMLDEVVTFLGQFVSEQIPLAKIAAFLVGYSNQWVLKLIFGRFKNN